MFSWLLLCWAALSVGMLLLLLAQQHGGAWPYCHNIHAWPYASLSYAVIGEENSARENTLTVAQLWVTPCRLWGQQVRLVVERRGSRSLHKHSHFQWPVPSFTIRKFHERHSAKAAMAREYCRPAAFVARQYLAEVTCSVQW